MRIPSASGGHTEFICTDIDDFVRYEQYHSDLVSKVQEQDLKLERKQYGNVIVLGKY